MFWANKHLPDILITHPSSLTPDNLIIPRWDAWLQSPIEGTQLTAVLLNPCWSLHKADWSSPDHHKITLTTTTTTSDCTSFTLSSPHCQGDWWLLLWGKDWGSGRETWPDDNLSLQDHRLIGSWGVLHRNVQNIRTSGKIDWATVVQYNASKGKWNPYNLFHKEIVLMQTRYWCTLNNPFNRHFLPHDPWQR